MTHTCQIDKLKKQEPCREVINEKTYVDQFDRKWFSDYEDHSILHDPSGKTATGLQDDVNDDGADLRPKIKLSEQEASVDGHYVAIGPNGGKLWLQAISLCYYHTKRVNGTISNPLR